MTTYDVYFRSGEAAMTHFSQGGNISLIEITNSDNDYYQNGIIEIFNVSTSQGVGDSVSVFIDETQQFNGYVNRVQQRIEPGKKVYSYQVVGKTYDLWRYKTSSTTKYTGYTSAIASSLVSTYCSGITVTSLGQTSGVSLTDEIDFSNQTVGDALVTLIGLDGFKFYVDNSNDLKYYQPNDSSWKFTILESQIIEMSPIEMADEDIINDVLVVGGSGYSTKTDIAPGALSSQIVISGVMYAQQFKAVDPRFTALRMYLNRTTDPNQPDALDFEIWYGSSTDLFNDNFGNYNFLDTGTQDQVQIEKNGKTGDWELILNYDTVGVSTGGNNNNGYTNYYVAQTFKLTQDSCPYKARWYGHYIYEGLGICEIRPTGVTGAPQGNSSALTSGTYIHQTGGNKNTFYYFDKQVKLNSGQTYALVVYHTDRNKNITAYGDWSDTYADGARWGSTNGEAWVGPGWDRNPTLSLRIYSSQGQIDSTTFTNETQYMLLELSGVVSSNKISLSGTNSGSTNWQQIANNTWYDFGFAYTSGVKVRYKLSSSGYYTPRISKASLTVGSADGSSQGVPQSGSKIEWSDDISFTSGDVPYPPSYSSWQNYSEPKLQLNENSYYWLIIKNPSGSSKYWTYYYSPSSTYTDGKIAMSWNEGYTWSTNASNPTLVPSGSMKLQLGWREGDIVATASDSNSISEYGRHFKVINDSTITTFTAAQARANAEVSSNKYPPRKGTITILGITDIDLNYKFSSNLTNFDIQDIHDIVSYTQKITPNEGFLTTIEYGKHEFDFIKKLSDLEKEVY
jgi:hypothetical protein